MAQNDPLKPIIVCYPEFITRIIPEEFLSDVYRWIEEIQETVQHINAKVVQAFVSAPRSNRQQYEAWIQSNHPELERYLLAMYRGKKIEALIYDYAFAQRQYRAE